MTDHLAPYRDSRTIDLEPSSGDWHEDVPCFIYGEDFSYNLAQADPGYPDEFPRLKPEWVGYSGAPEQMFYPNSKSNYGNDFHFDPDAYYYGLDNGPVAFSGSPKLKSERNPCGLAAPWVIPEDEHELWMKLLDGDRARMLEMVGRGILPSDYQTILGVKNRLKSPTSILGVKIGWLIVNELALEHAALIQDDPYRGEGLTKLITRSEVVGKLDNFIGTGGFSAPIILTGVLTDAIAYALGEDRWSTRTRMIFSAIWPTFYLREGTLQRCRDMYSDMSYRQRDVGGYKDGQSKYPSWTSTHHLITRANRIYDHCLKHKLDDNSLFELTVRLASAKDMAIENVPTFQLIQFQKCRENYDVTDGLLDMLDTDLKVEHLCSIIDESNSLLLRWTAPMEEALEHLSGGIPVEWAVKMCTEEHDIFG